MTSKLPMIEILMVGFIARAAVCGGHRSVAWSAIFKGIKERPLLLLPTWTYARFPVTRASLSRGWG